MNRLKLLREEKGLNQADIGKYLDITSQAVGLYENEKRDIPTNILIKLSEYFGVTTDYLLGKSDVRNFDNNISSSDINRKLNFYNIPVYGEIAAGQPNWAEECLEGYWPIDPELMGIVNPEEHYFLKVNGESMNKVIQNGSFALIHKQDYVDNGDIAVVLVNGDNATLKRFSKQDEIIVLSPESTDESFKQQIYTKETSVKVIGKYVGKMEINK